MSLSVEFGKYLHSTYYVSCRVDADSFLPYMAVLSLSFSSNKPVAGTYLPASVTMVQAFLCTFSCDPQSGSTCTHFRGEDTGPAHLAKRCQNWDWNLSLSTPQDVEVARWSSQLLQVLGTSWLPLACLGLVLLRAVPARATAVSALVKCLFTSCVCFLTVEF